MFKKTSFVPLLIFFLLLRVPLSSQATDSFDTTKVDEYVTNYIEKNGLPGAAIVVIKDGDVLYEKGFGHDSERESTDSKV